MSLTPETIDRLQAGAIATHAADLKADTPAIIVMAGPGKTEVQSIEHLQKNRSRFRGVMSTQFVREFVNYVTDRKGSPRGFISADRIEALACNVYFNLGTEAAPGHADDVATLKPKQIAAFSAMRGAAGKKLSQQELIDWIEDWHHILRASRGDSVDGEAMSIAAAVAGIRHIKLSKKAEATTTVGNMNGSRSAMEEIEANRDGTMPGLLVIKTEPFDGFKEREFVLRISILTGSDTPYLSLRWQRQEHQCEEIAQEFKEILKKELGALAESMVVGEFTVGK